MRLCKVSHHHGANSFHPHARNIWKRPLLRYGLRIVFAILPTKIIAKDKYNNFFEKARKMAKKDKKLRKFGKFWLN